MIDGITVKQTTPTKTTKTTPTKTKKTTPTKTTKTTPTKTTKTTPTKTTKTTPTKTKKTKPLEEIVDEVDEVELPDIASQLTATRTPYQLIQPVEFFEERTPATLQTTTKTYDEYEKYVLEYQAEYGNYVVVFYRCGSFYEIYSANDGLINIKEIAELLNIQITRKNKAKLEIDRSNYNMSGFPMVALKKFTNILIAANHTVVIVDQISGPPKPKRGVTDVISPGTKIDEPQAFDTNIILLATFEEYDIWKSKARLLSIGIATIDLTTGQSKVVEWYSTEADPNLARDELYKFILCCTPKEVVLTSTSAIIFSFAELVSYLDLSGTYVHDKLGKFPLEMQKIAHQEQALKKVFSKHGLLSPFEYLNLERLPIATMSFTYILDFCYRHNNSVLRNIAVPNIVAADCCCTLSYNSAKQLNIDALCKILNKCQTAMGRRIFKERLLNPSNNVASIEQQYNRLEQFISIYSKITPHLHDIYDLERLARKISLRRLHPADIVHITTTIESIIKINSIESTIVGNLSNILPTALVQAKKFLNELKNTVDLQKVSKYHLDNITESFFVLGTYPEVDTLQKKFKDFHKILIKLTQAIHPEHAKLEYTERDGYYITMTRKRFDEMAKTHIRVGNENSLIKRTMDIADTVGNMLIEMPAYSFKWSDFTTRLISATSSVYKITSSTVKLINQQIEEILEKLSAAVFNRYISFIDKIDKKYQHTLCALVKYIVDIDWYVSCAQNISELKYCRPHIANKFESRSYVEAKQLRHPIIERILGFQSYISNDVEIGTDVNRGMLLYGVNSSGKSSISKAVAICCIMAQAGMYVPCTEFIYWPYNEIFTRIPSGDDMMKGQSTFVIEISELRNILQRKTKNSLIIGDEVASGTESISALAIVCSAIVQLYNSGASFIFATHLHDLCKISTIRALNGLGIYHLTVRHDAVTDCLVYERILEKGQGDTMYGLEVCKALNLGQDFLNIANIIRHEILGNAPELQSTKKSRYNSKLYVDNCAICGAVASEVHHIRPQKDADDAGFIGTIHKNNLDNLANICGRCHDATHAGKIKITGYRQTTDGTDLIYSTE